MIKAKSLLFSALLTGGVFFSACSDTVSSDFCDAEKPCGTGSECNLATNVCESSAEPDAGGDIDAGRDTDATPVPVCGGANQCIAEVPSDWVGPVVYTTAATMEDLAACPSEYSDEVAVLGSDVALTQDCECSCGTVSNAQCGDAQMIPSGGPSGNTCQAILCPSPGDCPTTVIVAPGTYRSANGYRGNATAFRAGPLEGGTCTSPSGPSSFTSNFNAMSRLCRASPIDAECSQGEICAPVIPSGFNQQQCIASSGELSCPTDGRYTERQFLYATLDDQRACDKSACSCDVEGNCGGGMRFGDLVSDPITIDQTIFSCIDVPDLPFLFFNYDNPNPAVACTLNGAATITGAATPTGATTLCCEPAL